MQSLDYAEQCLTCAEQCGTYNVDRECQCDAYCETTGLLSSFCLNSRTFFGEHTQCVRQTVCAHMFFVFFICQAIAASILDLPAP